MGDVIKEEDGGEIDAIKGAGDEVKEDSADEKLEQQYKGMTTSIIPEGRTRKSSSNINPYYMIIQKNPSQYLEEEI
jgi:hypothetical protein